MSEKLNQGNKNECYKIFNFIDEESTGKIPLEELKTVLEVIGMKMQDAEFKKFMEEYDVDDNKIDFDIFCQIMANSLKLLSEKKVRDVFQSYDKDGAGFIKVSDWAVIMKEIGIKITEQQATDFIEKMTAKGVSEIHYEEIIPLIKLGMRLHFKPT